MTLKKDEKEPVTTTMDEEYDEDLVEAFGEENVTAKQEKRKTNVTKKNNNLGNLDEEIEKNISSYLIYGDIVKWLMIILAIIMFIIGLSSEEGVLAGLISSVTLVFYGFIASIIVKWFGYVLKCLYDIKNK